MRVLHLLSSTGIHGAETMTLELIRQLRALGANVELALMQTFGDTNRQIAEKLAGQIDAIHLLACSGPIDPAAVNRLRRLLGSRRIELIHCHGYKPDLYGFLARPRGVRLVATCHNWLGRSANMRLYAALDKNVLRFFDAVVGVSAPVETELLRTVARVKVHRIANGIDALRFAPTQSRENARRALGIDVAPLLGFVGRLTPEKGVVELIQATASLHRGGTPAALVVVGDGEDRARCERTAAQLGLDTAVRFLGTRADTPLIYAALDVFVLPSHQEGFPMVVLEAMAAGVPIVATGVGDIGYMLDDGACGVLVPTGDPTALASALAQLLTQPARAHALAERALARLRERFSSTIMARRYLDIYRGALAGPSAGRAAGAGAMPT